MNVRVLKTTADHDNDGVVVMAGTVGEVFGDGFTGKDGRYYVAVDFGNVVADLAAEDLIVEEKS